MTTETELKLILAPEYADQLVQHPLLRTAGISKVPQHLYNTYFDTNEHALLQAGIGLRVRRIGNKRLQTVKTAGTGLSGLHQRQEWEMEISGEEPNYNLFPDGVLPKWCMDAEQRKKIKPLFVTDFLRTTWNLTVGNDNLIEVALDYGEVRTSTARIPLCEVELELKAGTPDKLYKLALSLQKEVPLRIENKSKAALGYALHQPTPITFQKAKAVALTSTMTAEEAFIHIIWNCLVQLQANEDMVLYGKDIEGIHQMRIALRRLRSGLKLYKPLIPKQSYAQCRDELKNFSNLLGIARDWDVFALRIENLLKAEPDINRTDWEPVLTKIAAFQNQAYSAVREHLQSTKYSRLLLKLGKWLTQKSWRRQANVLENQQLDQPVKMFAKLALDAYYQPLAQNSEKFVQWSSKQRHDFRLAIKNLAYSARFFSELYPSKSVQAFTKSLAQVQEQLGILNDFKVAKCLFKQLELPSHSEIQSRLTQSLDLQRLQRFTQLEQAWQEFLQQELFWHLNQEESSCLIV
jgi:inorganic triphosphatase YgiF